MLELIIGNFLEENLSQKWNQNVELKKSLGQRINIALAILYH